MVPILKLADETKWEEVKWRVGEVLGELLLLSEGTRKAL